jgi:hypothetical protein
MRKRFLSWLAMALAVMCVPRAVTHYQTYNPPFAEYEGDPRLVKLQSFFGAADAPVGQVAHVFLAVADRWELDWRLLPSLSVVESSGGKAAPHNNLFGWDNGRARFRSLADSIQAVASRLGQSRLYKDKDLDTVLWTYNPDLDYARRVKSVMRRIAPFQ